MVDGVATIVPDDEFAERALDHQAHNAEEKVVGLEQDEVNATDRQAIIDEMQPTITEEEFTVPDAIDAQPERVGDEEPEPDDTAESTKAEVDALFGEEAEETDSSK
jgi:hypothetical protein